MITTLLLAILLVLIGCLVWLERIRRLLHLMIYATEPESMVGTEATEQARSCVHERRVDFGAGAFDEWECRDCGYHYGPVDVRTKTKTKGVS